MQQPSRVPWIDYLRGFITLLVVAHHSSLAYTTFAHFNKAAYNASTHPIVDCYWPIILLICWPMAAVTSKRISLIFSQSNPGPSGHHGLSGCYFYSTFFLP